MKIRPATSYQRQAAVKSAELLAAALMCARVADCPKLCAKIRRAIASAGGAVRHVNHRLARSRRVYGVLHLTRADRTAFANVERPANLLAVHPHNHARLPHADTTFAR